MPLVSLMGLQNPHFLIPMKAKAISNFIPIYADRRILTLISVTKIESALAN
jgi:hypothetical protein